MAVGTSFNCECEIKRGLAFRSRVSLLGTKCIEEVTECLNLCYDYRDIPATEPDDKEDERYASCHLRSYEDGDGIGRYEWAPFISMICHP